MIFPLTILGLAVMSAAVPLMCLFSLTVFSTALKGSDHDYAQSRAQQLLRSDLRNGMTAGLANVPDGLWQDIQLVSFESRFLGAQPLLRSDLRNLATAGLASAPDGMRQDVQISVLNPVSQRATAAAELTSGMA